VSEELLGFRRGVIAPDQSPKQEIEMINKPFAANRRVIAVDVVTCN
jgi:hypothetical protein